MKSLYGPTKYSEMLVWIRNVYTSNNANNQVSASQWQGVLSVNHPEAT